MSGADDAAATQAVEEVVEDKLPSDEESASDDSDASGNESGSENGSDAEGKAGAGSDGDSPRIGARHNKKKSLRKPAAKKQKAEKKTGAKRYVDAAAEESDGEGGNAHGSDDDEDDDDESSLSGGFIAKDDEVSSDSGASSSESDSDDDDSDASGSDAGGGRRRKLRRVAAKEEDEADEDDLALVAEAAEDGAVQLDARTKARIAQKLRKGGEEEDANGAGSGLATGDDAAAFGLSAATIAAANREAGKGKAGDDGGAEAEDEGPAAPSAFDKDYDSDEMDDFIVDDTGAGAGADAGRSAAGGAAAGGAGAAAGGAKKRRRAGPSGATDDQLNMFAELFGDSGAGAASGGAGGGNGFASLFDDDDPYGLGASAAAAAGGADSDEDDEADSGDEDYLPGAENAERRKQQAAERAVKIAARAAAKAKALGATAGGKAGIASPSALSASAIKTAAIRAAFEPAVLAQHYITDSDAAVRSTDEPERLQLLLRARRRRRAALAVAAAKVEAGDVPSDSLVAAVAVHADTSMDGAASWVAARLYQVPTAAAPVPYLDPYSDLLPSTATLDAATTPVDKGTAAIKTVLKAVNEDKMEVPFIWQYKRDELAPGMTIATLWAIVDLDDAWTRMQMRKLTLANSVDRALQRGTLQKAKAALLRDSLLSASSERGVEDVSAYAELLVTAGSARLAAEKSAVAAAGSDNFDTGRGDASASSTSGAAASGAARSDLYRLAYATDVHSVVPRIFISADELAQNMRANDKITQPPEAPSDAEDTAERLKQIAFEALGQEFQEEADVLRGARQVAAMEIAREPFLRAECRKSFFSRAFVSTAPTAKGKTDLDPTHPYFGLHVIERKLIRYFTACQPHRPRAGDENDRFAPAFQSLADEDVPSVEWENGRADPGSSSSAAASQPLFPGPDSLGYYAGSGAPMQSVRVDTVQDSAISSSAGGLPTGMGQRRVRHESRVGGPSQFLLLAKAEEEGFLTVTIDVDDKWPKQLISGMLGFYTSDLGMSQMSAYANPMDAPLTLELDRQRRMALQMAVEKILMPEFRAELRAHLTALAHDAVAAEFGCSLRRHAMMAPPSIPPPPARKTKSSKNKNREGDDDNENENMDGAGAGASLSGDKNALSRLPWQRSRYRVMVVAVSRPSDNSSDVAVMLDPRGETLDYLPIPSDRDARQQMLAEFMFAHNPDYVVINATGGLQRCRDMKKAVLLAGLIFDGLVKRARMNYKKRKELRVLHGATVEHSDDPSIKAAWSKTFMPPNLEAAAQKWARKRSEWYLSQPRCPGMKEVTLRDGSRINEPDEDTSTLPVLFVQDEIARVFMHSERGKKELPEHSPILRYAVSLGRYSQDPLAETAYIWASKGDTSASGMVMAAEAGVASLASDLLSARLHGLQSDIPAHLLFAFAERVMVEATSASGVDINGVTNKPHLHTLLQFVPGLGPRKAQALLQSINRRIRLRHDLTSNGHLGAIVYRNAAGFIRVGPPSAFLGVKARRPGAGGDDEDDTFNVGRRGRGANAGRSAADAAAEDITQYEPLDSTRIHPDHYWLARVVAKECDPQATTSNASKWVHDPTVIVAPHGVREVMRSVTDRCQSKLASLLSGQTEAYRATLPFEQYHPALQVPVYLPGSAGVSHFAPFPEPDDALDVLDLPSFAEQLEAQRGKLLSVLETIKSELRAPYREARRPWNNPSPDALFRLLTSETCTSLRKGALVTVEITAVQDKRLQVRMTDSGLRGSISDRFLPLPRGPDGRPSESLNMHFKPRTMITAKVIKVDRTNFYFECSALPENVRKANLPVMDINANAREADDILEAALAALTKAAAAVALAAGASEGLKAAAAAGGAGLTLRAIGHPAFKNVTRKEAEELLAEKPLYECVLRPSSAGTDHLTLTWKLAEPSFCAHLDILEEDKDPLNPAALGRRLVIDKGSNHNPNGYVYSDIDELLARHMDPMANHHRSLRACKIYRDAPPSVVDDLLKAELAEKQGRIPYFISPETSSIGYYRISYIMRSRPHHEPVKVTPGGFVYKGVVSPDYRKLVEDFKARVRLDPRAEQAEREKRAAAAASAAAAARAAASENANASAHVSTTATVLPYGTAGYQPNQQLRPTGYQQQTQMQQPQYAQQQQYQPQQYQPQQPVTYYQPPQAQQLPQQQPYAARPSSRWDAATAPAPATYQQQPPSASGARAGGSSRWGGSAAAEAPAAGGGSSYIPVAWRAQQQPQQQAPPPPVAAYQPPPPPQQMQQPMQMQQQQPMMMSMVGRTPMTGGATPGAVSQRGINIQPAWMTSGMTPGVPTVATMTPAGAPLVQMGGATPGMAVSERGVNNNPAWMAAADAGGATPGWTTAGQQPQQQQQPQSQSQQPSQANYGYEDI